MQQLFGSSQQPLKIYRVKNEFLHNSAIWPIGAVRLWTELEAAEFAKKYFETLIGNSFLTAESWFKHVFEEVWW